VLPAHDSARAVDPAELWAVGWTPVDYSAALPAHDSAPLTGLYVQSYFKERLGEEILRSRSHRLPLSIAIVDADHFKLFNDTYGHIMGDVVLRQIASLLRSRLRETDLVCRYGGEEFGIIMMQTDRNEAYQVCEKIRALMEEERFFLPVESFHPVQVKVTVSVGIAVFDPQMDNEEVFLNRADTALYQAKSKGRNRVIIGEPQA
jgi:diguanylate cyclase (GGDEF)-like protein